MKKRIPVIKENLLSNSAYKIVALIAAIIIWSTILWGKKDAMLVKPFEVEFIARQGHHIQPVKDRNVRVRVAGPRAQLRKFAQGQSFISINLQHEMPHRKEVEIVSQLLDLPTGVKLISITPRSILVDINEVRNNHGNNNERDEE